VEYGVFDDVRATVGTGSSDTAKWVNRSIANYGKCVRDRIVEPQRGGLVSSRIRDEHPAAVRRCRQYIAPTDVCYRPQPEPRKRAARQQAQLPNLSVSW